MSSLRKRVKARSERSQRSRRQAERARSMERCVTYLAAARQRSDNCRLRCKRSSELLESQLVRQTSRVRACVCVSCCSVRRSHWIRSKGKQEVFIETSQSPEFDAQAIAATKRTKEIGVQTQRQQQQKKTLGKQAHYSFLTCFPTKK